MNTAVVAITSHGAVVGAKLKSELSCILYLPDQIAVKEVEAHRYGSSTKDLISDIWPKYDAIIFIMAMGIVTRIIKDHIKDKHTDPAVVVVDEMGRYAISALSGHEGGANRLAEKVALVCGGDFVVTTGSEAIKALIIGMGCKRGMPAGRLEDALKKSLEMIGRDLSEVRLITSVENKSDEAGLHELSEKNGIPLKFISRDMINVVGENFEGSELVKKNIGVPAVAEPCAMLGGFRCQLLLKKTKMDGITVAIAEERFL
ncbi:MAG: cobalamin biosynthesis protein [Proteobacteria bacterium]|nr:cobalamin biosynthesis protein [Pseudomonadota bacterium]